MTNAITSTTGQVQTTDQVVSQETSHTMANIWLATLGVCLLGTLLCTAVLLAWPIVAQMIAG